MNSMCSLSYTCEKHYLKGEINDAFNAKFNNNNTSNNTTITIRSEIVSLSTGAK